MYFQMPPPRAVAAQQPKAERFETNHNVYHVFEDPNVIQSKPNSRSSTYAQQQQQQLPYGQTPSPSYSNALPDPSNPAPVEQYNPSMHAGTQPIPPMDGNYTNDNNNHAYNSSAYPANQRGLYGPSGVQQPYPQQQPMLQQQQQQQQQQQHVAAPYDYANNYAQQQPAMMQQVQAPVMPMMSVPQSNALRMCEVQFSTSNQRIGMFDHPSVPRMLPEDVYSDMDERSPAPAHITTCTRETMRLTLNNLPASAEMANTVQLPIGMLIRPFAHRTVPEVDFVSVDDRMVRCRRCSVYINPYVTFLNSGRSWQCIMCHTMNQVSDAYYARLDGSTGLREDVMSRPELLHCSVDFRATKEFLKHPPHHPIVILMLDCTHAAASSGMLAATCRGALRALEAMREEDSMYMGVVGYDSTVYFFNLRASLTGPHMMAAPDTVNDIRAMNDNFRLNAIELPCRIKDLVVSVRESYALLRDLFEKLPVLFEKTMEVSCAYGPALTAAISLISNSGGKVVSTLASMPSAGDGKLKHRFNMTKMAGQAKEYTTCLPASDWYKQRAFVCSNSAISVDVIVHGGPDNVDLATIAPLARFTSGVMHYVDGNNMSGLPAQVERMLTGCQAFDAMMRIRTSHGVAVSNSYAHCHMRQPELLALPIATADSTYALELKLTPYFKSNFTYIQVATIYTSRNRERRIRVHTIQIPVASSLSQVINSANSVALGNMFIRLCVMEAQSNPFPVAQKKITDKLVAALRVARQEAERTGVPVSSTRLALPDSMKYIPQILCGFFRSPAVGGLLSTPLSPDERVAFMSYTMTSPAEAMLAYLLGWFYKIAAPQERLENLPVPIYASVEFMRNDSIYLMNLGSVVLLWFGSSTSAKLARAFGQQPTAQMTQRDETAEREGDSDEEDRSNYHHPSRTNEHHPQQSNGRTSHSSNQSFSHARSGEDTSYSQRINDLRTRTNTLIAQHRLFNRPIYNAELTLCVDGPCELNKCVSRMCMENASTNLISYSNYLDTIFKAVMQKA